MSTVSGNEPMIRFLKPEVQIPLSKKLNEANPYPQLQFFESHHICFFFSSLVLLNKLLEDGNTLFRHGRLNEAAYRYEYALKRLPRLKQTCSNTNGSGSSSYSPTLASTSNQQTPESLGQDGGHDEDIFLVLKSHLLLNLSR